MLEVSTIMRKFKNSPISFSIYEQKIYFLNIIRNIILF